MTGWRLPVGGLIDREDRRSFTFEGQNYAGYGGDTLASALLANGVTTLARSFKYHRPRGVLAAGFEEPNALVQLEKGAFVVPNAKATVTELYDGLIANPVNAWPSLRWDAMALNDVVAPLIPAAFYYKTFMWPDWHLFEPMIRRAAGLGRAPDAPDPDHYETAHAECDVLIIGAGRAGLSAALELANSGRRIMVVEADFALGGRMTEWGEDWGDTGLADDLQGVAQKLHASAQVQVLTRTMAFGAYDHGSFGLVQRLTDHLPTEKRAGLRERLWKVRTKKALIATGAHERPMVFPGNDRPGVMLASAALTYARRYGVGVGRKLALVTNNATGYVTARQLREAGVTVEKIIDSRATLDQQSEALAQELDLDVAVGCVPTGTTGRFGVQGLRWAHHHGDGVPVAASHEMECDGVIMSSGWSPAVHLYCQAGQKLRYCDGLQGFVPSSEGDSIRAIGAANGYLSHKELDADVRSAVTWVINGGSSRDTPARQLSIKPLWAVYGKDKKAWVDFQNDVTLADVALAKRENFKAVEHLKRYTTMGMATDQGRTSNVNAIGAMGNLLNKAPAEVGTTKFRPPYDPVSLGAFASRRVGYGFAPKRYVPSYDVKGEYTPQLEDYGPWQRPAYFALAGERETDAVAREVKTVRSIGGLFDASPLGKIEVRGPDAATFLSRFFVQNVSKLKVGRCRYTLTLNEHGIVFDDGVLARMADDHFLVGTTSGHAHAVEQMMDEWLQSEWPDLQVAVQNVTHDWAVMNVCGPRTRTLLSSFQTDLNLSADGLAPLGFAAGTFAGVPARVQRVSFTGELSYEVSVPWRYGEAFWEALLRDGSEMGFTPFGIEALMVMRTEKGFLHVGSDTDGTTLPQDIGFGVLLEKRPDDFIGKRSAMRPDGMRADRRQLVGLDAVGSADVLPVGAHIRGLDENDPGPSQGWVTSSVYSPTLNRPIAMGVVSGGRARLGQDVQVWHLGKSYRAKLVDPRRYDREGERANA